MYSYHKTKQKNKTKQKEMKKEDQAKDKHNTLTHKERYVDDDVAKQRGDRIVTYIY